MESKQVWDSRSRFGIGVDKADLETGAQIFGTPAGSAKPKEVTEPHPPLHRVKGVRVW